jgi:glycosyltransferase involved in cell wall biosynthesis
VIEGSSGAADAPPAGARVISTIIPCYNHAALLPRAIESVAAGDDDLGREIIIVDDGSTDDTPAVCAALAARHRQVRVIRQVNGGLSNARNSGIRAASGAFLHFLDADDYVAPSMYAVMVRALEQEPDAHVAYCGVEVIDEAGGGSTKFEGEALTGDMLDRLRQGNLGPVHTFVVRREAVIKAGFFDEQLQSCEDWDYWLRVAMLGYRFVHVPQILAYYERQSSSMSRNYPTMIRSAKAVLAKADRSLEPGAPRRTAADMALIRRAFFDYAYTGVLRTRLESGAFASVALEGFRLARADVRSLPLFVHFMVNHKRVIAHGARALLARSFASRGDSSPAAHEAARRARPTSRAKD